MVKKENMAAEVVFQKIQRFAELLTEEQLAAFRHQMSVQSYGKGQPIYLEGDVPEYLHFMLEGKAKVYMSGVGGKKQIMRVVKPVELFGYRAYFAGQNYIGTAATLTPCTICHVPMRIVSQWMAENVEVSNFFINLLSYELGNADVRTVNLTQKHVRGRLADALLFLRDSYGLEEDHSTISVYLSREDLANLSNMTTSNAIRTLSAFAEEHLIAIDGRKIKILDLPHLQKIAKIG